MKQFKAGDEVKLKKGETASYKLHNKFVGKVGILQKIPEYPDGCTWVVVVAGIGPISCYLDELELNLFFKPEDFETC